MNKKVIFGIIAIIIIICVGFGGYFIFGKKSEMNFPKETQQSKEEVNVGGEDTKVNNDGKKSLIVYFSLPENKGDAKEDSTITINGEVVGNTQYVANLIKDYTGADIYRIEPVKNYNVNDHQALIADAKEEQNQDARPEIKTKITNFDEYDIIYIGYPIWWSDFPQIMYTFFELYDFNGKTVIPFSTNGGSGLAGTINIMKSKLTGANIEENAFQLYRDNMEEAPDKVESWLKEIKVLE